MMNHIITNTLLSFLFLRCSYAFVSQRSSVFGQRRKGLLAVASDTDTVTEIRIPPYDDSDDKGYPSVLHSIYVKSVLEDEENEKLVEICRQHAAATGRWEKPDTERHSTYATCDFPVDEAKVVESFLQEIGFDDRIWESMHEFYGIPWEDMSYLDLFVAQYRAKTNGDDQDLSSTGDNTMDRLEAHRDGSLLSFTITLTDPGDFEGGGTFFEALRGHEDKCPNVVCPGGVVRPKRAGDGVFHSGKPLHGAEAITRGERIVLVGFVDVAGWRQRPGVLAKACEQWGRMDVADKRYRRQLEKIQETDKKGGWFFSKARGTWLPGNDPKNNTGRSFISNFSPAFPTVARRADPAYQRLKRLKAEDRLLRTILLSEDEVAENLADFTCSGEISIT